VGSASYAPFGGVLSRQGFTSLWGYAGEYHDPTTGLQYLRARWYQPAIGRFTQGDPFPGVLALPLTLNPYVYGLNSPTNFTDPTGKDPLSLAGTLIAGVVGGFVTGVGFYTIQVMLQAQICSSTPPWDWRVALRWGLAGAAIGSTFVLTVWGLAELLNLGGLLFSGVLYETMPWLALAEARLAQGLLGGLAAGIGYTIPAVIFGTFDNRELAVAIMIGGFMGAYPEFLGSTPGQAILRGALSNELQYIGSGIITENRAALTSVSGHLSSVILGGVIGKLQGPSLMPGLQNVAAHTIG